MPVTGFRNPSQTRDPRASICMLRLQNILVKLEAPEAEQTLLFVAHYGSVAAGPGAGDNMLSVCTI